MSIIKSLLIHLIVAFVFLFVLLPRAMAAPTISITSNPGSVTAGDEFKVNFTVSSGEPDASYYKKGVGGDSNYDVETLNAGGTSWNTWNAGWPSMPQFNTNSSGIATTSATVRFKPSATAGSKEFFIRIRYADKNYDSGPVTIPAPRSPTKATTPPPFSLSAKAWPNW